MTRVEQLNAAVAELRSEHDRWANDHQEGKVPTNRMLDGIVRLKEIFDAGPCPASHIRVNNAIVALFTEYRFWDMRDNTQDREPRQAFWTAMGAVFDEAERLQPMVPPPLPGVATLRKQGSTDEQIARYIYGFRTSDGTTYDENGERHAGPFMTPRDQVDHQKLEQEAANPGSVVPADWMNPQQRAILEAVGYFDTSPAVQVGPVERSREERLNQAVQLLSEGGTVQQVINCTGLSESEIRQIAVDHEIASPDNAPHSQAMTDGAIEAAILELAASETNATTILSQLRSQGIMTNIYRVKQILEKVAV